MLPCGYITYLKFKKIRFGNNIFTISVDDTSKELYAKWAKDLEQEVLSTKESSTIPNVLIHNPKRDANSVLFNLLFPAEAEEKDCNCLPKKSPNFLQAIYKNFSYNIFTL